MIKKVNNRGLSTVVATLLVILITLIAIAIIWVVLRNVIQHNAEEISFNKFTVHLEITHAHIINSTSINVTVRRSPGEGELYGILFIIYDANNSEIKRYNISLIELQERRFSIILSDLVTENAEKVAVAPIFRYESGKEVVGDITDEWIFSDDSVTSPLGPSPDPVPDTWTGELLTNGGFELGNINNWYTDGAYFEVISPGHDGSYAVWYNHPSSINYDIMYYPIGQLQPDLDLSSWAAQIDAGDARINASGWGISREPSGHDLTRIQFIFLDASRNAISTARDTGYVDNGNWWNASVSNYEVPANTRYLRVWANTYDPDGSTSGSVDSFSVTLGYF